MQYWQSLNLKHFHTYALNCCQFNSRGIVFLTAYRQAIAFITACKTLHRKKLNQIGTICWYCFT